MLLDKVSKVNCSCNFLNLPFKKTQPSTVVQKASHSNRGDVRNSTTINKNGLPATVSTNEKVRNPGAEIAAVRFWKTTSKTGGFGAAVEVGAAYIQTRVSYRNAILCDWC